MIHICLYSYYPVESKRFFRVFFIVTCCLEHEDDVLAFERKFRLFGDYSSKF